MKSRLDRLNISLTDSGANHTIDNRWKDTWNTTEEFLRDFIVADLIGKNEMRKVTSGDPAQYESIEKYSARQAGLTVPGNKSFTEGMHVIDDTQYGDKENFGMVIVPDSFGGTEFLQDLQGFEQFDIPTDWIAEYGEGKVNKTDSMGFTSLDKYRRKMMGTNPFGWTDRHEQAYQNYSRGRAFADNEGRVPPLVPLKTSYEGLIKKKSPNTEEGKVIRVMIKHAIIPVFRDWTKFKGYEDMDQFRDMLENDPALDSINTSSAIKIDVAIVPDIQRDEAGKITNLDAMPALDLSSRWERIPQSISEKTVDPKWGSQIRKIVLSSMNEAIKEGIEYEVGGKKMTAEQVRDLYQKAGVELIDKSQAELDAEMGYDKLKQAVETGDIDQIKAARRTVYRNIQRLVLEELDQRDIPENYENAVKIVLDSVGNPSFRMNPAFPTYQRKFEQIVHSLFKNRVLTQTINGASMVQIAEYGQHRVDNTLRFVTKGKDSEGKPIVDHAEVDLPFNLASQLGLDAKEFLDKNGDIDVERIREIAPELLTMVAYRIPTQAKNSMLPIKIRRILPRSVRSSIIVPGAITTQMGSDYDLDKLFLMQRNYDVVYKDEKGEFTEESIYKEKFSSAFGDLGLTDRDFKRMIKLKKDGQDVQILSDKIMALQVNLTMRAASLEYENRRAGASKVVKVPEYNTDDIKANSREAVENLIIDLTEGILRSPYHAKEMIKPLTINELEDIAMQMKDAHDEFNRELYMSDPGFEEEMRMRNIDSKQGISIWASATTGHAIGQFASLTLKSGKDGQRSPYAFILQKGARQEVYTDLSRVETDLGNLIISNIEDRASIAVDNPKNPVMMFLNDNEMTDPVINYLLRTGAETKGYSSNRIATLFSMQPSIRRAVEIYRENPNRSIQAAVNEAARELRKGARLGSKTVPISISGLESDLGKTEGIGFVDRQLDVLTNFALFHEAGRVLMDINSVFNIDRIGSMNSASAIEEAYATRRSVDNNKIIGGFEDILDGDAYPMVPRYWKILDDTNRFMLDNRLSPLMTSEVTRVREKVAEIVGRDSLSKEVMDALHNDLLTYIFSLSDSPIYDVFKSTTVDKLFRTDKGAEAIITSLRTHKDPAVANNPFVRATRPSLTNRVRNEQGDLVEADIKTLEFGLSFGMLGDEQSDMTQGFRDLLRHSDESIQSKAVELVFYQILSTGLSPSANSFADLIPIEVWEDPNIGTTGESLNDFFTRKMVEVYGNKGVIPNIFPYEFVQANIHRRRLARAVRSTSATPINWNGRRLHRVRQNTNAWNKETEQFANMIRTYDQAQKKWIPMQYKGIGPKDEKGNTTALYAKLPNRGVPFKLKELGIRKVNKQKGKLTIEQIEAEHQIVKDGRRRKFRHPELQASIYEQMYPHIHFRVEYRYGGGLLYPEYRESGELQKEGKDSINYQKADSLQNLFSSYGIDITVEMDTTMRDMGEHSGTTIKYNPLIASSETIPHEFGHVLVDSIGLNDPLIKRGIAQLKGTKLWKDVERLYPELSKDRLGAEVLVQAIGKEYVQLENLPRWRLWLSNFFRRVAEMFGVSRDVAKQMATDMFNRDLSAYNMDVENLTGNQVQHQKTEPTIDESVKRAIDQNKKNLDLVIKSLIKRANILNRRMSTLDRDKARDVLAKVDRLQALYQNKEYDVGLMQYLDFVVDEVNDAEREMADIREKSRSEKDWDRRNALRRLASLADHVLALKNAGEGFISLQKVEATGGRWGEDLSVSDPEFKAKVMDPVLGAIERIQLEYLDTAKGVVADFLYSKNPNPDLTKDQLYDMLGQAPEDITWQQRWLDGLNEYPDPVLALVHKALAQIRHDIATEMTEFKNSVLRKAVTELEAFQKRKGVSTGNNRKMYDFMLEKDSEGNITGKYLRPDQLKGIGESDPRYKFAKLFHEEYVKSQQMLPPPFEMAQQLPGILKYGTDRLAEGKSVTNQVKHGLRKNFKITQDETDYGVITRESGAVLQTVPIHFTKRVGKGIEDIPPSELSLDLPDSLYKFMTMSRNYRDVNDNLVELEAARDLVIARKWIPKEGKLTKALKAIKGRTEEEGVSPRVVNPLLPQKGTREARAVGAINDFFSMHVYGQSKRDEGSMSLGKLGDINIAQAGDALAKYTAITQLGLNLYSGINNVTIGQALNFIESLGREFYTTSDWRSSHAELWSPTTMSALVADSTKRFKDHKISLFMDQYDIMRHFSEFGDRLKGSRLWKRIMSSGAAFFMYTFGEFSIAANLAIAMSKHHRIVDGRILSFKDWAVENNKDFSKQSQKQFEERYPDLWSSLQKTKDNKIESKVKLNTDEMFQYIERVKGMFERLHGNYRRIDQSALNRHLIGRLMMMFRKWMRPAWNRRFARMYYGEDKDGNKIQRYNYQLRTEEGGTYRVAAEFLSSLMSDWKHMGRSWSSTMNQMPQWKKAALRKVLGDIGFIVGTSVIIQALGYLGGDDEDKEGLGPWFNGMATFQAHRLRTEFLMFIPPLVLTEGFKIVRSPAASLSAMQRMLGLVWQIASPWDWAERYETGKDAGKLKIWEKFKDILPIVNQVERVPHVWESVNWMKKLNY